MKPSIFTLRCLLLCLPLVLFSQISIDQSDMPGPGDTLRVSMTSVVPVNYAVTGSNFIWDFSMLEAMNQRVDTNGSWDSSSSFGFEFPGMFYFSTHWPRSSFVDGWMKIFNT